MTLEKSLLPPGPHFPLYNGMPPCAALLGLVTSSSPGRGLLDARPRRLLGSRLSHGPSLTQRLESLSKSRSSPQDRDPTAACMWLGWIFAPPQSLCLFHSPTLPESSMLGSLGQAGRLGWMLACHPPQVPHLPWLSRNTEALLSISAPSHPFGETRNLTQEGTGPWGTG